MTKPPLGRFFSTPFSRSQFPQRPSVFPLGLIFAFCWILAAGAPDAHAKGKRPPDPNASSGEFDEEEFDEEEMDAPVRSKDEPVEVEVVPVKKTSGPGEPRDAEPSPVVGSAPPIPEPAPASDKIVHRVWLWQETRDCLWTLARKYYRDPWKWKVIYLANRSTILNPDVIYPKQRIEIPRQAD